MKLWFILSLQEKQTRHLLKWLEYPQIIRERSFSEAYKVSVEYLLTLSSSCQVADNNSLWLFQLQHKA